MPRQARRPPGAPAADRPNMPGYGIDTAGNDATLLPWEWATDRLESARNYWVVSVRPDRRPHAMPVWGLWIGGAFYFSTGRASRKARNLAKQPDVVVHLESGEEAVIIEGQLEEVTDRAILEEYADSYHAKYDFRPDLGEAGSINYRLVAKVAFGWREADYPSSATRWTFDARGTDAIG